MEKPHAKIVSHTEKRTRLRVASMHRKSADIKKFVAAVKSLPSVDDVQTNLRTGSILIKHKGVTRDQFKGVFEDIGCILHSALFPDLPAGKAKLDLPQAIADLDVRLGLIDSSFSLRNLIPLSLGTLSIIQMRRQGIQISTAPWYILVYLAYYTYMKLHKFEKVVDKVTQNSNR